MRRLISLLFVCFAEVAGAASTAEAARPAAPTELTASRSAGLGGAVDLRWHAVKGATVYAISISRETEDNWHEIGSTPETAFQVNELPEETEYYFRIASISRGVQSEWSSSIHQVTSGKKRLHAQRATSERWADQREGSRPLSSDRLLPPLDPRRLLAPIVLRAIVLPPSLSSTTGSQTRRST